MSVKPEPWSGSPDSRCALRTMRMALLDILFVQAVLHGMLFVSVGIARACEISGALGLTQRPPEGESGR